MLLDRRDKQVITETQNKPSPSMDSQEISEHARERSTTGHHEQQTRHGVQKIAFLTEL